MTVWIGIGVVAFGSWYFDHYRKARRRADDFAITAGIRRMPGESNEALLDRSRSRYAVLTGGRR